MAVLKKWCILDKLRLKKENKELKEKLTTIDNKYQERISAIQEASRRSLINVQEIEGLVNKLAYLESKERILKDLMPSWYWVKAVIKNEDGTYSSGAYEDINESFREEFLCGLPKEEIIGKTDGELSAILNAVEEGSFTFGQELCADSDKVVIHMGRKATFTENGKINNKMMYVMVHKDVLYDPETKEPIATVGIGRNITTDYVYLEKLRSATTDENTKHKLEEYLYKYHFEPNMSCKVL